MKDGSEKLPSNLSQVRNAMIFVVSGSWSWRVAGLEDGCPAGLPQSVGGSITGLVTHERLPSQLGINPGWSHHAGL